jgi:soluble lytic murein transglycosylase
MFRIITLFASVALCYEAHAVTIDQELSSCSSAWAAGKNRDFAKAVQLSDSKKCPLTQSFMTWKMLRSDKTKASFSTYARFISQHPEWPWMPVLMTKAEQAINDKTSDKDVISWYEHRDPHTATGAIRYMKALKNPNKLQAVVRKAWHRLDLSAAQQASIIKLYGSHLRQADHRARTEWLLNEQKLDQAKRMTPLLSKENQAWSRARLAFIEGHPDPHSFLYGVQKSHDLAYEEIRWHRKNDNIRGGQLLLNLPPKTTQEQIWWKERSFFAREALNQNDPQLAYELMASHPYSDGAEYADAEWFCGWVSLRFLNNPEQAIDHFKKFAHKATLPKSKAKASFWLARTYEVMGNAQQAEQAYRETAQHPATFYGMIAKRKYEQNIKLSYAKDPQIDPQQWNKFQNQEFVRLSRMLSKAGLGVEAEPFLYILAKRTAKGNKAEKIMGLKVINEVYSPYTVFGSKDIRYQEADLFPWLYPRRSLDPKVKNQGVDSHLIHAIMRQESGFNARATSPAGAMGMMQLMPKTAANLAKKKGYRHHDGKLHSDPDYNILIGTHYFKEMLDKFQGSYVLAIAAYNCGPGPVAKWVEKYGDPRTNQIDTVDFIERIPYSETREYVKSVLANFYIYQALEK